MPANATVYDLRSATPGAAMSRAIWATWASVGTLSAIASTTLIVAIASSPRARAPVLNLYIAALFLPDVVYSVDWVVTCLCNLAGNRYASAALCELQSFCTVFGVMGSLHINAVIALEVHRLLSATRDFSIYVPPTRRSALLHCLGVFAWCTFVSSWPAWGLGIDVLAMRGVMCVPTLPTAPVPTFFFFPLFFVCAAVIPLCICLRIAYLCWWGGLLRLEAKVGEVSLAQSQGCSSQAYLRRVHNARAISLFFKRILVCLFIWQPAVLITFVDVPSVVPIFLGYTMALLQCPVSVTLVLTKDDIRQAVLQLLMCAPRSTVAPHDSSHTGGVDVSGSWSVNAPVVAQPATRRQGGEGSSRQHAGNVCGLREGGDASTC